MRRRCEQSLDANAAAAEQAEDEEKTELDESSEDEDEDEEQLSETAIIKCQGCKATENTGGPETQPWLMSDCCSVWMHGKCVGRWTIEKCEDLPFVCFECQRANIQTMRAKGQKKKQFGDRAPLGVSPQDVLEAKAAIQEWESGLLLLSGNL